ncbi:LysE/ArgO family amino acid transporter [Gryllotalpicola ginsengisoli]|uniref:LysE/ArgO family amino acid transporter n=1 Tax=Gryllotalpicola ginsengisoli TaxID=444608 RepID=UPI0009D72F52
MPSVEAVTLSQTLFPALLGLGTGLSLIVAIGAQNAYLLRLGIVATARVIVPVLLLCALSDAVLITAGTLGIGALVHAAPTALTVVRVVGAAFLFAYGLMAARRAWRPKGEALQVASQPGGGIRLSSSLATVAALTWLNPHVYLDTVVFLGSVANQQGHDERWWWVAGAIAASFAWFFALGFGARMLRPIFSRPQAWRVLDASIAVLMVGLGLKLVSAA